MKIKREKKAKRELVRIDWAIKNILRKRRNFDILNGFLSELLKQQITIKKLLESESTKDKEESKLNRVDLLVETETHEQIIIEIQAAQELYYLSRILFATSKMIIENIHSGESYKVIPKVISVNILFFRLGNPDDYIYIGRTYFNGMHNNNSLKLNKKEYVFYKKHELGYKQKLDSPEDIFPEYYLIEVPEFKEEINDPLDEWVYFFKNGEIKTSFAAQGLQSAAKKLNILCLNEEERRDYERHQVYLHDVASEHAQAAFLLEYEKSRGKIEGKIEVARLMKKKGFSIQDIAACSGLSEKDILAL